MRDTDKPDPAFQPLGPPIKKPDMPKPHQKVGDTGVVRQDPHTKRFYTCDPKNEAAL